MKSEFLEKTLTGASDNLRRSLQSQAVIHLRHLATLSLNMDPARQFYANLPPPAECLAILVGLSQLTVFGLGGIANPLSWSKAYGLPIVQAPRLRRRQASSEESQAAEEAEKAQIALVSALSARSIQSGVLILALACYARDRRAVGIALIVHGVSSLADSLIVRWFGNTDQAAGHLATLAGSLGIGSILLRWTREDAWW